MPHYRCFIPQDALSFDQRQEIALAFTDIHCGSTGAPRSFVSVTFLETPEGQTHEHGKATTWTAATAPAGPRKLSSSSCPI